MRNDRPAARSRPRVPSPGVACRQAGRLLLLSLLIAGALWATRADRLPLLADPDVYALDLPVPLISLREARDRYEAGSALFVDTRRGEAGRRPTIPGSFVIRESSFADDLDAVMDFVYPEDDLILYGEATPLPVAAVAARFLARGYRNLWILQGGLAAWTKAAAPLRSKEPDDE